MFTYFSPIQVQAKSSNTEHLWLRFPILILMHISAQPTPAGLFGAFQDEHPLRAFETLVNPLVAWHPETQNNFVRTIHMIQERTAQTM